MKQIRSSKTPSKAAGMLMLLAVATMTANAADWCPKTTDVLKAIPDVKNAAWVSGISRDNVNKQAIQLGLMANTRTTPPYFYAYYTFPKYWDQKLTAVKKISASFLTPIGTSDSGGSPRFNLEVENADGTPLLDANANQVVIYLDPVPFVGGAVGVWRDCDFTGSKTGAIIDSRGVQYIGDGSVSAWSKLVSDPYYANKRVKFLYLIQDTSTGPNYVDVIRLDSALFTKKLY